LDQRFRNTDVEIGVTEDSRIKIAVEAHRVVRRRGSHIFYTIDS
jgi:hypothetical protein